MARSTGFVAFGVKMRTSSNRTFVVIVQATGLATGKVGKPWIAKRSDSLATARKNAMGWKGQANGFQFNSVVIDTTGVVKSSDGTYGGQWVAAGFATAGAA